MRLLKYAIVAILLIAFAFAYNYYALPSAVRAFRWNQSKFEEFVLHPPELGEGERQPITERTLLDAGFVAVRRRGDCLCFYHQGFVAAIDSWNEIVYSPKGAPGLPDFRIGQRNTLYHLQKIDNGGRWYHAVHD